MTKYLLPLLFLGLSCSWLIGQKMLLLEKANSPNSRRIYVGDFLQYRIAENDFWSGGEIYDLQLKNQLIVFEDRYVDIQQIESIRFPRSFAKPLGISLMTFGAGWSAFAAVGYNTDGNPDTQYSAGDAIVSATAIGLGFLIPKIFGANKVKLGKKRRLRIIDVSF